MFISQASKIPSLSSFQFDFVHSPYHKLFLIGFVVLQYLPHLLKTKKPIYDRHSVLFSIVIIWLYAQLLTSSTVYNHKPTNTQKSCRTDQAGLLSTAPW